MTVVLNNREKILVITCRRQIKRHKLEHKGTLTMMLDWIRLDTRAAELQIVKMGEAAVRGTMEPVSKSKSIRVCVMVLTLLVDEPVPIWCSWSLRR